MVVVGLVARAVRTREEMVMVFLLEGVVCGYEFVGRFVRGRRRIGMGRVGADLQFVWLVRGMV